MYDLLLSGVIGFVLGYLLLLKVKPIYAFLLVAAIGALLGWQMMNIMHPNSTSLGYLLSTNPELQTIWTETHNAKIVAYAAKQGVYILVGFDGLASVLGYMLASFVKHRKSIVST
jgi:hypothetical protein